MNFSPGIGYIILVIPIVEDLKRFQHNPTENSCESQLFVSEPEVTISSR
jgi:hypothetical protein